MPIRSENRQYYDTPAFADLRARLKLRAGNRCELCRAPGGELLFFTWSDSDPDYQFALWWDGVWIDAGGQPIAPALFTGGGNESRRWLADGPDLKHCRLLRVVLTVAHLDHDPRHQDDERCKYLCQRCHLAHDRANNYARRRRYRAAEDGQQWLLRDVELAETPEREHDAEPAEPAKPTEVRN